MMAVVAQVAQFGAAGKEKAAPFGRSHGAKSGQSRSQARPALLHHHGSHQEAICSEASIIHVSVLAGVDRALLVARGPLDP